MKANNLIALFCTALLSPVQAGTIGVDPISGVPALVSGFGGLTLGWEFEVTSADGITVDGLGFWDHQSNGFLLGQTFQVGLWEAATGTLLRNTGITSASALKPSVHPDGDWRVNSVAPVFLAPGFYRIGALMPESGANPIVDFDATFQAGPGISVVSFLRQLGSLTLAMPDIPLATSGNVNFGPTFTYSLGPIETPGQGGGFVAPSNYKTTAGNAGLNTLLRDSGFARTYQMQFSPAALGGLPVGARITELRLRLGTNAVSNFPANTITWSDYEVTLAQAANPVSLMTGNFAANMLSPVLVKAGPLSISANSFVAAGTSPNPFGSLVVFDTPYIYQGGDLVMLFSHTGSDANTNAFLDAASTTSPGYGTAFRAFSASTFHSASGGSASLTIVQIVFSYTLGETISRDGTNVVIAGMGGAPGGTYRVVASTNVALPASQWTPVATNFFDGTGSFHYTNALKPALPAQFFRIGLP